MTPKRIALAAFIVLLCIIGFFLSRTHCQPPTSKHHDPAAIIGHLYLLNANVPF